MWHGACPIQTPVYLPDNINIPANMDGYALGHFATLLHPTFSSFRFSLFRCIYLYTDPTWTNHTSSLVAKVTCLQRRSDHKKSSARYQNLIVCKLKINHAVRKKFYWANIPFPNGSQYAPIWWQLPGVYWIPKQRGYAFIFSSVWSSVCLYFGSKTRTFGFTSGTSNF